ncbi:MAG: hypothetical protein AB7O67_16060 [Vicinamibacterales bacterium]
MSKPPVGALLVSLVVLFLAAPVVAHRYTTVVTVSGDTSTGENSPGWLFNRDVSTSTPFEFTTHAASRGRGSLYVLPISAAPADKFIGELFLLASMGNVDSIAYDFRIGSGGDAGDANEFYMSVYANFGVSDPAKYYDCRYSVVPAAGSLTDFTTVTFDPDQAYPVATRGGASASPFPCPAVPSAMGADATLRMVALNVGDTSANDATLDGYLDNVVVRLGTGTTVYDFESTPQTAADCRDGGWRGYGFRNQGQCVASLHADDHHDRNHHGSWRGWPGHDRRGHDRHDSHGGRTRR